MAPLALFVILVFIFSLVSKPLEGTIVTAPIVFTIAGMLTFSIWPLIQRTGFNAPLFLRLAEIGLVLLLFTDASRTELNILRGLGSLPGRLVSVGTLLTIAAGAAVGRLVFPQLSIWGGWNTFRYSRADRRRPRSGRRDQSACADAHP